MEALRRLALFVSAVETQWSRLRSSRTRSVPRSVDRKLARRRSRLRRSLAMFLPAALVLVPAGRSAASEDGEAAAALVSEMSYRHYLDDVLYTHDGDDRHSGQEHDLCRDNIFSILQGFGLAVDLHAFTYESHEYYNVVATHVGSSESQYVVGAHFDSYGNPGADDDASGVAAFLEIARILSSYDSDYTIKYIAFDREEQEMKGSYAYVDDHLDDDIVGMIQLDMIAWNSGDDTFYIGRRPESAALADDLEGAIYEYGQGLSVEHIEGPTSSDHKPFEDKGHPACVLREHEGFPENPCYHQSCDSVDTPEYLDYDYATRATRGVIGFLADYAGVTVNPCGDGVLDPGEFCDTGIPAGQQGACPDDCDTGSTCITGTLYDVGTCAASCKFVEITTLADGDGCCPPGANAISDDDCPPVCENGVCEQGEDVACLPDCECDYDADCDDSYPCTFDKCNGGLCTYTPGLYPYGDVNLSTSVNVFDVFCILEGIAGDFSNCALKDDDLHPCQGDGVVNLFDAFAVLDAIAGIDPCCGS